MLPTCKSENFYTAEDTPQTDSYSINKPIEKTHTANAYDSPQDVDGYDSPQTHTGDKPENC